MRLDAARQRAWDTWVPEVVAVDPFGAATAAQPDLGSGAVQTGTFCRLGRLVFAEFTVILGTGADPGVGIYAFSLPVLPKAPPSTVRVIGHGAHIDLSGSADITQLAFQLNSNMLPAGGISEVQTVTVDATGGTFILLWKGRATSALAYNISAADLQTALVALTNIDAGDVTVTGGPGDNGGTTPYVVTWAVALGDVPELTTDDALLTGGGGSATIATTTPGQPTTDGFCFAVSSGAFASAAVVSAAAPVAHADGDLFAAQLFYESAEV